MEAPFRERKSVMKVNRLMMNVVAGLVCAPLMLTNVSDKEKKVPLGSQPEKFTLKDIHYLPRTLDDCGQAKVYVLAFTTVACPLVQRYLPRLQELSLHYREQGVRFIAVNVGPEDSLKEIAYQAIEHGAEFPFLKDFDGQCARALGATRTPQIVLLDAEKKIRYRGRIANQYRLGAGKPSVDRADLKEAIEDLLSGRKVRVKETVVDGCAITFPEVRALNTSF